MSSTWISARMDTSDIWLSDTFKVLRRFRTAWTLQKGVDEVSIYFKLEPNTPGVWCEYFFFLWLFAQGLLDCGSFVSTYLSSSWNIVLIFLQSDQQIYLVVYIIDKTAGDDCLYNWRFYFLLLLFLGAFAKLRKDSINFVMSVRLSAWKNSAPTGRNFIKFDTGVYFENL